MSKAPSPSPPSTSPPSPDDRWRTAHLKTYYSPFVSAVDLPRNPRQRFLCYEKLVASHYLNLLACPATCCSHPNPRNTCDGTSASPDIKGIIRIQYNCLHCGYCGPLTKWLQHNRKSSEYIDEKLKYLESFWNAIATPKRQSLKQQPKPRPSPLPSKCLGTVQAEATPKSVPVPAPVRSSAKSSNTFAALSQDDDDHESETTQQTAPLIDLRVVVPADQSKTATIPSQPSDAISSSTPAAEHSSSECAADPQHTPPDSLSHPHPLPSPPSTDLYKEVEELKSHVATLLPLTSAVKDLQHQLSNLRKALASKDEIISKQLSTINKQATTISALKQNLAALTQLAPPRSPSLTSTLLSAPPRPPNVDIKLINYFFKTRSMKGLTSAQRERRIRSLLRELDITSGVKEVSFTGHTINHVIIEQWQANKLDSYLAREAPHLRLPMDFDPNSIPSHSKLSQQEADRRTLTRLRRLYQRARSEYIKAIILQTAPPSIKGSLLTAPSVDALDKAMDTD
ncbi:hypothetical protein HDV05_008669 [Chytridiales sp. JEL 0842]|nr:hypothetical protein HDV05_008669 [Chytridiales sp. JEL 0842]